MSRPYINCGAQNAIEARFCRSCGHSFEVDATSSAQPTAPLQPSPSARTDSAVVCAKCGKENRDGTKFCRGCGAALAESRPENAAQEPHALVRPSVVPTPQKAFERSLRPPNAESIAPSRTAPPSLLGRLDNQWKMPAMIVGGLALIGIVGWFGYLRFAEKSSTATELATRRQTKHRPRSPRRRRRPSLLKRHLLRLLRRPPQHLSKPFSRRLWAPIWKATVRSGSPTFSRTNRSSGRAGAATR